jgi:O-antigen/teichoic acid export membrane protein
MRLSDTATQIGRDTILNLLGNIIPVVLTLLSVPLFLEVLGPNAFGLLSALWLIIGYFGSFDLGLGRAVTNHVARTEDTSDTSAIDSPASVFWTALLLTFAIGVIAAVGFRVVADIILQFILHNNSSLRMQVTYSIYWIGSAIPATTVSSACAGALQGKGRFLSVNAIEAVAAAALQLVPLIVAMKHAPFSLVIDVTACTRDLGAIALLLSCLNVPAFRNRITVSRKTALALLRYGGWVSLSAIISPILTSADRALIARVLGTGALAFYGIAFGLASRIQLLSASLSRTLFPRFSQEANNPSNAVIPVRASNTVTTALAIGAIVIAGPFLTLWIGQTAALHTTSIALILMPGVWINAAAFVPYAWLQAKGHPELVAGFHVAELCPFLVLLWFALHIMGLAGAALAWDARVAVDALLLFNAAKTAEWSSTQILLDLALILASVLLALVLPLLTLPGICWRAAVLLFFAYVSWRRYTTTLTSARASQTASNAQA